MIARAVALLSLLLPGCTWYTATALRPDGQLYVVGAFGFAGFYVPIVKRCAEKIEGRLSCRELDLNDEDFSVPLRPTMTIEYGPPPAARPICDSAPGRFSVSGLIVTDADLHLTWQKGLSELLEMIDGDQYCRELDLEGRGWRLPKIEEFGTLLCPEAKQGIAQSFDATREWFWTSRAGEEMTTWAVNLWSSTKQLRRVREKGVARCVRPTDAQGGVPPVPEPPPRKVAVPGAKP